MASEKDSKTDLIQSVALALQLLETLANTDSDIGVTALASALGTTKSRIHRHLRTLMSLGYITQSAQTERYRIGSRLIALGQAASGSADLTSVALPHMRVLRDTTGHAVSLGQIEKNGIRILNTLHGNMQIDVGVRPGSLLGFTNSAQGKVALSTMSEKARSAALPRKLTAATQFTITDQDEFKAHIATIRKQGWATAANQTAVGLNTLAAPLFDATGGVVGAVGIVDLVQFLPPQPDQTKIDAVMRAARQISRKLGYEGDCEETDASDASPSSTL